MSYRVVRSTPFQPDLNGNVLAVILETNDLAWKTFARYTRPGLPSVDSEWYVSPTQEMGMECFELVIKNAEEAGWER